MVEVFLDAVLYQIAPVTCTMCREVNRDSVSTGRVLRVAAVGAKT